MDRAWTASKGWLSGCLAVWLSAVCWLLTVPQQITAKVTTLLHYYITTL